MASGYRIPADQNRVFTMVANSRFVATVVYTPSVEHVKTALSRIREEMPDASHHVYAFRVGYGGSVTDGMSDAGEPSGTAGPPVMAVLRGADIGDTLVVVTRYFGGTKLGTGGLVRAYGDAARAALETARFERKIARVTVGIEATYSLLEIFRRLISEHQGLIENVEFDAQVVIIARFPVENFPAFANVVIELSAGQVQPVILERDA